MADVLKIRGDVLGLGKTAIEPVKVRKLFDYKIWKTSSILAVLTLVIVVLSAGGGALHQSWIDDEKAMQAAAAQAEAAEREKNRELDARLKQMSDLGMRYQYQLEQARKEVFATIENLESYRDKIPQVKKFLAEYQLPEDVRIAISEPVDLQSARSADTYEFQVQGVAEPKNLEQARAKWQAILSAAGRYAEGIDRNNSYFNGYLKSMNIDEQFKAEFGKRPMQQAPAAAKPQVDAEPVTPAEPVVEQAAEPAAQVAEAEPAPAPKPAARPAAQPKQRTIQTSDGRTQVLDWPDQ